jgi:hypothetical protein
VSAGVVNADHAFNAANHATDNTAHNTAHNSADRPSGALTYGHALLTSPNNPLGLCGGCG